MPTTDISANRGIVAFIKDWLARESLRGSMAELDGHERERILVDCGLSQSEFDRFMETPFVSEDLLSPMMRSAGLHPSELASSEPALMRDLERVCTLCISRKRCRRDLADGRAATTYREFCPNAPTFDDIAAGQTALAKRAQADARP